MKKITIKTKNGDKIFKCLQFNCDFDSFKEIWELIHEKMMKIAEKYKNCKFENYDCLSFDDGRYVYAYKKIIDIWKQAHAEDAWIKIFECNHDIYYNDKAENIFNGFLPFIYETNYIIKNIEFDAADYQDYLLICEDENVEQIFIANDIFIDYFTEEV